MNGFDEQSSEADAIDALSAGAIPPDPAIPVARPITQNAPPAAIQVGDPFRLSMTRTSAWLDMGALILCLAGFRIVAEIGLARASPLLGLVPSGAAMDSVEVRRAVVVPVLFVSALATCVIVGAILRYRRQAWASVGLTRRNMGSSILVGLGATGAAYLLIGAALLVMTLVSPSFTEGMHQNATNLISVIPKMSPAVLLLVSLAVGYYEELLFRGFLMTRLRRCTGSWIAAVVLSTALFTSLHASVQIGPALIFISILSLVLSVVTIWRRSLLPAIVTHASFDFSQFLLLYYTSGDAWK